MTGFANAITNNTSPSDAYIYYLPLGVELKASTKPTCNSCLQRTMNIFSTGASNSTLPVARTYNNAAAAVNQNCGSNFVNGSVAVTSGAAGSWRAPAADSMGVVGLLGLVALVVSWTELLL